MKDKIKDWKSSLEERRKMTFEVDKSIFVETPTISREITLDINNRCNHKCFFVQILK